MDTNTKAIIKYALYSIAVILIFNLVSFIFLLGTVDTSSKFNMRFDHLQFELNGVDAGIELWSAEFALIFIAVYALFFIRAVKKKEILIKKTKPKE